MLSLCLRAPTDLLSLTSLYLIFLCLSLAVNMPLFLCLFSPHLISTLGMHPQIQELQHMALLSLSPHSLSLPLSPLIPSLCLSVCTIPPFFTLRFSQFVSYFSSLLFLPCLLSPLWAISSSAGTVERVLQQRHLKILHIMKCRNCPTPQNQSM